MPLWNPHVMAGRPYHANSQSAIFSPFSTPAYVMPVSRALAWMAALKLFVAAFGAYLLARALRLRFAPALLAGLVYAFGLFFVAWLAWPLSSVWAWLPWLLALTEVVVRRPGPLPAAGLAVVVALQFFGGHPESSFHVLFAALAFFVLRLIVLRRESPSDARPLGRPIAAFAGAIAGGGLLAAISLVAARRADPELGRARGADGGRSRQDQPELPARWRSCPTTGAGRPRPCCRSPGSSTTARSTPGRCR